MLLKLWRTGSVARSAGFPRVHLGAADVYRMAAVQVYRHAQATQEESTHHGLGLLLLQFPLLLQHEPTRASHHTHSPRVEVGLVERCVEKRDI
jgi:hypothetical protein